MITKQERIKLRSLAQSINPTVWVGKDNFDESVIEKIKDTPKKYPRKAGTPQKKPL